VPWENIFHKSTMMRKKHFSIEKIFLVDNLGVKGYRGKCAFCLLPDPNEINKFNHRDRISLWITLADRYITISVNLSAFD
jgi:hypothetical protein